MRHKAHSGTKQSLREEFAGSQEVWGELPGRTMAGEKGGVLEKQWLAVWGHAGRKSKKLDQVGPSDEGP